MRELYNEFFYIPKHGKIREKVMLARVATTVVMIVMCLAAMSITAYAYFSHNITSGSNTIKAAHFEANVSIKDSNNDPVAVTKDGRVQTATLDAGEYTIELTRGNSTANKGFCIITIGDKTYYTDQIGVDAKKNLDDASVKFYLLLSAPTKIEVLSHWGTSIYYGYKDTDSTEIFIDSEDKLDLTTKTTNKESDQSGEKTGAPSKNTTTGTELSSTQTSESKTTPSTETTTPSETTTPETTAPSETTTPETTGTSEPIGNMEPSSTTESSVPANTTKPSQSEQTDTTESKETKLSEENTGRTEKEESKYNEE